MSEALTGAEFKNQLREGKPKMGLFLNSHSPTVAEQLAHSGYDWLLVDTQHGPMGNLELSAMLAGIANGGAKSMVRVQGYHDRGGIQQALDMGADGVLVPYINTADEARQAVSCARYPTVGTRSVYFPQRSMNRAGLLGYAGAANDNVILALQVETDSCINNIDEIAAVVGVDLLFLGQNDLCISMGLYEKYKCPDITRRPSWAPPPISFGEPRSATTSSWACSCLEPPASANSWKKASLSSASVTICTTS
jgi:4-hydroxy-2-oxoheptanedioate aldolase